MASKNTDSPVRSIALTTSEQAMLCEEANRVVMETLAVNELFITCDRQLPKSDWKHLRTRENIHVFRTRTKPKARRSSISCEDSQDGNVDNQLHQTETRQDRVTSNSRSGSSSGSSDNRNDQSVLAKMKPSSAPLLVATGVISGTVEDAAFGALAHTETLWRSRDAHLKDEYAAIKILAVIREPTAQDPFRSLVLKWSTKRIGSLARMRDCVFIEANGIAFDSKGVPFAYNLVHSIDNIARIPGLKHLDVVRVNISTCYISRRYNQSSIEVFCRGFADAGGNFIESLGTNLFSEMILSFVHIVDCAFVKKLMWLTHKKRCANESTGSTADPLHCNICSTGFSSLCNLIRAWGSCQACQTVVCPKCTAVKKIQVEVGRSEMTEKVMAFCLHCMVEAKEASTREVALSSVDT
uniref:FYVE-type domain-containing protein n=1 Tax=Globisporangium ultimum (strain ATCC 200006 / CBS 805.95 / DAOM BR144) TaxID=431595 RepID=K3WFW6_GLOUD